MWTFTDTIMQDAPYVITAVVIIALIRYVYVNRHDFRFQHWKNIILTVYLMAVLRVCTYVPVVKKVGYRDKYVWIFDRYVDGTIVYGKVILSLIIVSALAGVLILVGKMLSKRSNKQS